MSVRALSEFHPFPTCERAFAVGTIIRGRAYIAEQMATAHRFVTLLNKQKPVRNLRVAVIGAGPVGLAVAKDLQSLNVKHLTVVEREERPLQKFFNAPHRLLYPAINEWPDAIWESETYLEFCNQQKVDLTIDWRAGTATSVAESFEAAFAELKSNASTDVIYGADASGPRMAGNEVQIGLNGTRTITVDVAIYCVGLGTEITHNDYPGYWTTGMLNTNKLLIAGNGDGAFIDCFKFLLGLTPDENLMKLLRKWRDSARDEYNSCCEAVVDVAGSSWSLAEQNRRLWNDVFGKQKGLQALIAPMLSAEKSVHIVHNSDHLVGENVAPVYLCLVRNIIEQKSRAVRAIRGSFDVEQCSFATERAEDGVELTKWLESGSAKLLIRIGVRPYLPGVDERLIREAKSFVRN